MVKLIIEGGGYPELDSDLRKAFNILLRKAGIETMPRIIAAGGRAQAYDRFQSALRNHEDAILLIDSERSIDSCYADRPWDFLKSFEHWEWLPELKDEHCHLMVQCMEAWFLADSSCLVEYYGKNFNVKCLPKSAVENVSKDKYESILSHAATQCKNKNNYDKGRDSFKILMKANPAKIRSQSPWAERFFSSISQIMKTEIS